MNIFSWFGGKEKETPTKTVPRRPARREQAYQEVANSEMLKGLYKGDYSGLQFASPLAYTPIATPVQLMGLPIPVSEDERTQEVLKELVNAFGTKITRNNTLALLLGTTWIFPRFDARTLRLIWEEIPDDSISDIFIDLLSGLPTKLLTDENIALASAENLVTYYHRKRVFTPRDITVTWIGDRPAKAEDYTSRNLLGILPINFAHEAEENGLRGTSVLGRVIRDLKDYHDIDYRVSELLTKFKVKQVQEVRDPNAWAKNNLGPSGVDALGDFDILDNDFIINKHDEETTDFAYMPLEAIAPHEKVLERKFLKIVEGSGIPELFWGPLATGNNASTEKDMQQAIDYVERLRAETTEGYIKLFRSSLQLLGIARGEQYAEFDVKWNKLDSVSAETRGKIFRDFAEAMGKLVDSAAITKKQMYELWMANYPDSKPGTYEEFIADLNTTAMLNQFNRLDYFAGLEDSGATGEGGKQDA